MRVALLVIVFMVAALSVADGRSRGTYWTRRFRQQTLEAKRAQEKAQRERARKIAQVTQAKEEAARRRQQMIARTQCTFKQEDGMPQH